MLGLQVGVDAVGVGDRELGEGLLPVRDDLAFDEAALGLAVLALLMGSLLSKAVKGRIPVCRDGLVSFPDTEASLSCEQAAGAFVLGLTIAAYSTAMGMYLVSDPARFLLNVQDLLIAFFAVATALGFAYIRRRVQSLRAQA